LTTNVLVRQRFSPDGRTYDSHQAHRYRFKDGLVSKAKRSVDQEAFRFFHEHLHATQPGSPFGRLLARKAAGISTLKRRRTPNTNQMGSATFPYLAAN
jgi:hypothetical protein